MSGFYGYCAFVIVCTLLFMVAGGMMNRDRLRLKAERLAARPGAEVVELFPRDEEAAS